jgi:hypothetical protein
MLSLHPTRFALLSSAFCLTVVFQAVAAEAAPTEYNHDMSPYVTLTKAALKLVGDGDLDGALKKSRELEGKWDSDTADLKKADRPLWDSIDKQMDVAIAAIESKDAKKSTTELKTLLDKYDAVPKPKK